jgi:hypothetical protein
VIDAVGLTSTHPAAATEVVPSSLELDPRRLSGGAKLACSPSGLAGPPERLCSVGVGRAPRLGLFTRLLAMPRRPPAVSSSRALWIDLDPFPVGCCALVNVLLTVSAPFVSRGLTKHWVVDPSLSAPVAFIGAMLLRMLLLPFECAPAHTCQPVRAGVGPLPYVSRVAEFAARPITVGSAAISRKLIDRLGEAAFPAPLRRVARDRHHARVA